LNVKNCKIQEWRKSQRPEDRFKMINMIKGERHKDRWIFLEQKSEDFAEQRGNEKHHDDEKRGKKKMKKTWENQGRQRGREKDQWGQERENSAGAGRAR
jgi:hypothetical protein